MYLNFFMFSFLLHSLITHDSLRVMMKLEEAKNYETNLFFVFRVFMMDQYFLYTVETIIFSPVVKTE